MFIFFLFLILPFSYVFFLCYIFFLIFFIVLLLLKIIFYFLVSALFINELFEKIIKYSFPKEDVNNLILCILSMSLETIKKQAFMNVYLFAKNNSNLNFKFLPVFIISYFIKFLFFLIFNYNVKIVKITCIFLNIVFKNSKQKLNQTQLIEVIFSDFFLYFDEYLNKFVNTRKIIINNLKIRFNPKSYYDVVKDLLQSKFKLSNKDLIKLAECLNIIKINFDIRYIALRTEVFKNYPNSFKENQDGIYFIGEKVPHSSLIIPFKIDEFLTIRETTKKKVFYKNLEEDEIKSDYFDTGFKSSGSINSNLNVYKTSIIISNNDEIFQLNSKKLLNNVRRGLVNKDDYLVQLIDSMFKPIYIFEKGNLYKDPKYKNLHDKIVFEFNLENKSKIMNSLNEIAQIWHNNYSKFCDIPNQEMMKSVIKFIVIGTDYIIDPKTLQLLYDL